MLKISLLQTPGIELDGAPVSLPFKKADALIYYMVVRRSATRQELIDLLWENCDETTGLKYLRNTLYNIKKSLGGDFLLSPQKSLIVVNGEWPLDCDYDRFVIHGDLSSYHGDFLQGFSVKQTFSFDEWMNRTREKLREQYLEKLAEEARRAQESGSPEEAQRLAADCLREDPYNEPMACFLMNSYRDAGQFSRAAQVYQTLKDRLTEDLGAEPQESTGVLYYEIMNQWNENTAPAEEAQAPVPVGRETAYSALRAAAASLSGGAVRRCTCLLTGEMGSGKSKLIDHFLQYGDLGALSVFRCRCLQSEQPFALAPWAHIIQPLWQAALQADIHLPLTAEAQLDRAFSLRPGAAEGPGRMLRQWDQGLEDSLLLLFAALTHHRKLLLLFEDLHCMDPDSLRLLEALLRRPESGAMMVVLTARSEIHSEAQSVLSSLESDGLLHRLELRPLTQEQTKELLRREIDGEMAGQLAPRFYEETGGNLYLLQELIRAYRRSGSVQDTFHALDGILLERITALPESVRCVADCISVFSRPAQQAYLLELLDGDLQALSAGLEVLCSRGIVEECRVENEAACQFVHHRIRALVHDSISIPQRQELHRRLAALLRQRLPENGENQRAIADHCYAAGDSAAALEYRSNALMLDCFRAYVPFSLLGGEQAVTLPPAQAEQELRHCLQELSPLRADKRESARTERIDAALTCVQGLIALFAGETERGSRMLGSLSGRNSGRDDRLSIQLCYHLGQLAIYLQNTELAQRYTETGIRLLGRRPEPIAMAQFQRLRGCCFSLEKAYDKASYYHLEAIDTLEQLAPTMSVRLQLAAAYCDYGRVCRYVHGFAEACSYFKKALALLEDDCPGKAWVCVHYGRTVHLLGDHLKARELFEQACVSAQNSGELWGRTAAAAYTALYLARDGDHEQAAVRLQLAQETQQQLASPLEGIVLCSVCMELRHRLEMEQRLDSPLGRLLPSSTESYARQGLRLVSGIPADIEAEQLVKSLREGLSNRQTYRASELYSKSKHFMAE